MAASAISAAVAAQAAAATASSMAADKAAEEAARASIKSRVGLNTAEGRDAVTADWVLRAAPFMRTLADPTRFNIVLLLREHGAMAVGTLTTRLKLGQGTVSEALGRLKRAGVVFSVRAGKSVEYRLNDGYFRWKLRQVVDRLKGR